MSQNFPSFRIFVYMETTKFLVTLQALQGFPYWCCAVKVSSCSSQVLCAAPLHFIWGLAIIGIGDINPPFPSLKNTTPVLQIRDFQLVDQWAEGLKGILRPQLVQGSCIFYFQEALKMLKISVDLFYITLIQGTLMRNNNYKLNWYYEYNIQEANNTKILSKYTFTY